MLLNGTALRWVAAILLGGTLVGCSCGSPASKHDGGPDARVDPGTDARVFHDAGRDATADAVVDPDDPGWVRLPGLPDGCIVERAERPEVLFEPVWEPCPDADGCTRLTARTSFPENFMERVGHHDGERGYFAVLQWPAEGQRHVVLAASEGPPLAAWRDEGSQLPGNCFVHPVAIGADSAAINVLTYWTDVWPMENRVYHAGLDEIGRQMEPDVNLTAPFLPGTSSPQNIAVSATTAALEIQLAAFVAVVENGKAIEMENLPGRLAGNPQNVIVVGRHVFWQEWGDLVRVAHGSLDQPTALFHALDDADVKGFSTDGLDMAWVQAYDRLPDGSYQRAELWTAPYVEDPARLQPRFLLDLSGVLVDVVTGTVRAGLYMHLGALDVDHLDARVYDLSDGRMRRFAFPEHHRIDARPTYMTAEELVIPVRRWGSRGDEPTSLYRIDLTSLPYEEVE